MPVLQLASHSIQPPHPERRDILEAHVSFSTGQVGPGADGVHRVVDDEAAQDVIVVAQDGIPKHCVGMRECAEGLPRVAVAVLVW
eukprot:3951370-Alexandrium_andersonii.AAC.1